MLGITTHSTLFQMITFNIPITMFFGYYIHIQRNAAKESTFYRVRNMIVPWCAITFLQLYVTFVELPSAYGVTALLLGPVRSGSVVLSVMLLYVVRNNNTAITRTHSQWRQVRTSSEPWYSWCDILSCFIGFISWMIVFNHRVRCFYLFVIKPLILDILMLCVLGLALPNAFIKIVSFSEKPVKWLYTKTKILPKIVFKLFFNLVVICDLEFSK